jgi:hypothetical protein
MEFKGHFLLVVLTCYTITSSYAQVWGDSPKKLPDDLPTATILFLKFDSVSLPETRPKSSSRTYYDKWQKHNASIPTYNTQLRAYASKYPYNYKIVSMTDTAKYRSYGAKYLFWFNPFDMFTIGGNSLTYNKTKVYNSASGYTQTFYYAEKVELGIIDLTSDKTYLIDKAVKPDLIYKYDKLLPKFFDMVNKQFGTSITLK